MITDMVGFKAVMLIFFYFLICCFIFSLLKHFKLNEHFMIPFISHIGLLVIILWIHTLVFIVHASLTYHNVPSSNIVPLHM